MKPFFKWVGGKTRLLPDIEEIMTRHLAQTPGALFSHYYEPFAGGAAVLFGLGHYFYLKRSISDININLMETYSAVQSNPDLVIDNIKSLRSVPYRDLVEEFNRPRVASVRTAALFLALNHLCFNGLYRVNKKGEFNSPHGKNSKGDRHTLDNFNYDSVQKAAESLQGVVLCCCPFQMYLDSIEIAPHNTFIFCDPPYLEEFSSYDASGFTRAHHARLQACAADAALKGALVVVCGSDNPASRQIYGQPYKSIQLKRTVGASKRGTAVEALYVFSPR